MNSHRIVSREEWLEERRKHLEHEKQLTRMQESLAAERRGLPWVKIDKGYTFDGPNGRETLADLFGGKRQLIVNHFMFGPGWGEGCPGCSFGADHVDAALPHLLQRDVNYVAVSRAPLAEIEPFRKRMGWHFKWVSSHGSDFNYDFHVSFSDAQLASGKVFYNFGEMDVPPYGRGELQGTSVFAKDDAGEVFHTYSSYARGGEAVLATYACLDVTPLGRDENGPTRSLADWVKHHDRYVVARAAKPGCH